MSQKSNKYESIDDNTNCNCALTDVNSRSPIDLSGLVAQKVSLNGRWDHWKLIACYVYIKPFLHYYGKTSYTKNALVLGIFSSKNTETKTGVLYVVATFI